MDGINTYEEQQICDILFDGIPSAREALEVIEAGLPSDADEACLKALDEGADKLADAECRSLRDVCYDLERVGFTIVRVTP